MGKTLGKKILIGNLSNDADELSIRKLFEKVDGTVISIDLPVNKQNGRGRGYAFVQMANQQETDDAILKLDGSDIGGRRVSITLSEAEAPKNKRRLLLFNF